MDVTCEKCGTEYEFDDTLASERGTTVKCTQCGHLFKVFRHGAAVGSGGSGDTTRPWLVRGPSGQVDRLASLRDLQQRISRGQLTDRYEISRTGQQWKPLGEIAELQTFFAAARAGAIARQARRDRLPTALGLGPPPSAPARPPSSPPPPPSPSGPVPRVSSRPPPTPPQAVSNPPSPPPSSSVPPRTQRPSSTPPFSPVVSEDAPTLQAVALSSMSPSSERPSPPSSSPSERRRLYVDEEEDWQPRYSRRSSVWPWVVLGSLLACAGVAAANWKLVARGLGLHEEPAPPAPREDERAAKFLSTGDAALSKDHGDAYEEALLQYTKASALLEDDVRVLRSMAHAHALWAQALHFDATDLEAGGQEAGLLRKEQLRHARQSLDFARRAIQADPEDLESKIIFADALRLNGDLEAAKAHLSLAPDEESPLYTEQLRIRALIAAKEQGGLAAAKSDAEHAVQLDPDVVRTRLLLARALLAERDLEGATEQIRRILSLVPAHPGALGLRSRVSALASENADDEGQVEQPVAAVQEVAAAPRAEPSNRDSTATDRKAAAAAPSPARTAGVPSGRDADWYIEQGNEALTRQRLDNAERHFQAALRVEQGSREALAGLGFVALDRGQYATAIRYFAQCGRFGDALIGLGQAYRALGRYEEALAAYERYLNELPGGSQVSIARAQSEQLRKKVEAMQVQKPFEEDSQSPSPGVGPPPEQAPSTPPGTLPAPRGTDPQNLPASSDPPAVGSEPAP